MAATTLLIEVTDFANYTDVSSYINTTYIDKHILAAQNAFIKPILGDTLYTELQTEVEADTLSYDNSDLLDVIRPYLIYKSTIYYLPFAQFFATNMGIRVYQEENSRPANDDEIQRIVKHLDIRAEMYENELRRYLYDNQDTYSDYDIENQPNRRVFPKIGHVKRKDQSPDVDVYF